MSDGPASVPHSTFAERLTAAATLLAPVTETPRLDAEILLAHALGISRSALLARLRDREDAPGFDALVERRAKAEPIGYILGTWEFFSLSFIVRKPLLVPRPETEHLVESVLAHIGDPPARVLDIGTGTGCVAVSIAVNAPQAFVLATDISVNAIETATENARRHAVTNRITFRRGDLFAALEPDEGPFDVICSNPPYVEAGAWNSLPPAIRLHEDPGALLAGPEGLDAIARIIREAPPFLRPGGMLALEMDDAQRNSVECLLQEAGYRDITFTRDLAGLNRIASARAVSVRVRPCERRRFPTRPLILLHYPKRTISEENEMAKRVAFAVAAHPDDIEFMMAGTLLLLGEAGYELHTMNLCNGSCGTALEDHDAIIARRTNEARDAAHTLGAAFHE
ncbi:MAG: peptide chain release factor N(5)-glutamine methyltransferase, partial [Candidatus Hydrogenedentes bacterium]|nr:peptide chain release factor N(5)-glutamine methyltransferase [Candidatus Hydrogenedentota bacterium]